MSNFHILTTCTKDNVTYRVCTANVHDARSGWVYEVIVWNMNIGEGLTASRYPFTTEGQMGALKRHLEVVEKYS